uniref:Nucleoporin 62 n=1 Tax=Pavo cristatus TaxID=9049 RepID=A0A8C9FA55_PAVCR
MSQFNFGSGPAGGGFSFSTPKTAASTTAATGFSFTPAPSSGFTFGSAAPTPASSQPVTPFSFSTPASSALPTAFSFGTPATASTAAPAASVFPLGGNAPKLNFGGTSTTQATGITGGFGFGTSAPTSVPSSQAAAPSGFVFGSAAATTTTAAQPGTTGGFTFSSGTTTQAGTTGFNIGATSTAAPQAAPTGLTFGAAPAAVTTTTASLGSTAQPAAAPFSLGGQSSGECLSLEWELSPGVLLGVVSAELLFLWPVCVYFQITSLHREVEKVKLDQKRLDQELDFILSQQKELEDLLTPLEESVKEQSGTIYLQHADEERERTYKLAENIDAQLKRMAQDLKDIIEHLNTSGRPADTSDPLQQICKILNAHMDSLQWIDQNSALLQRKVEEVTKVCESRRKEQERSFRITFD